MKNDRKPLETSELRIVDRTGRVRAVLGAGDDESVPFRIHVFDNHGIPRFGIELLQTTSVQDEACKEESLRVHFAAESARNAAIEVYVAADGKEATIELRGNGESGIRLRSDGIDFPAKHMIRSQDRMTGRIVGRARLGATGWIGFTSKSS